MVCLKPVESCCLEAGAMYTDLSRFWRRENGPSLYQSVSDRVEGLIILPVGIDCDAFKMFPKIPIGLRCLLIKPPPPRKEDIESLDGPPSPIMFFALIVNLLMSSLSLKSEKEGILSSIGEFCCAMYPGLSSNIISLDFPCERWNTSFPLLRDDEPVGIDSIELMDAESEYGDIAVKGMMIISAEYRPLVR